MRKEDSSLTFGGANAAPSAVTSESPPTKAFWLSWYNTLSLGEFELHRPWWISGYRDDDAQTICAAIIATSEDHAKDLIVSAYDKPPIALEWRFCEERPNDWSPFCGRFPRREWMRWPSGEAT